MDQPREILVADRFNPLRSKLLGLLGTLSDEDWDRPTAAGTWSVKDVCAHVLGGDVAIISARRDQFHSYGPPVGDYEELITLVDRLNAEWVLALSRISPRLLRDLLALTGPLVDACFTLLDPMALGGAVSWAGPEPAPVWFDVAREFTERWHHQQQIRDATGKDPLYEPYFLTPVLDTFVRAIPHSFRATEAPVGTAVRLTISGAAGGTWLIRKYQETWGLLLDGPVEVAAAAVIPQDLAWRMFTKGISPQKAISCSSVTGALGLTLPIFYTVSIIG